MPLRPPVQTFQALASFALLIAVLSSGIAPSSVAADDQPERLPISELKYRILRVHKNLLSIQATEFSPDEESGDYSQVILAAQSPGFLFHDSSHGSQVLAWQDDPNRQVAYVTPNRVYNVYPLNHAFFSYTLKPDEQLPGTLHDEFFFLATGLWPLKQRQPPRPQDLPFLLHEIAQVEDKHLVLRSKLEKVEGRWCHVLENHVSDYLWLDAERGCCLVQREVYEPDTGALMSRFVLGEHQELAPGIWIPRWIQNIQFDFTASTEEGRKRRVVDARTEIRQASVNAVDEDMFLFRPTPGMLQINPNRNQSPPQQVLPGGYGHLDRLARWLEQYALAPASPPAPRKVAAWESWSPVLVAFGLILIAEICRCVVQWRSKQRAIS